MRAIMARDMNWGGNTASILESGLEVVERKDFGQWLAEHEVCTFQLLSYTDITKRDVPPEEACRVVFDQGSALWRMPSAPRQCFDWRVEHATYNAEGRRGMRVHAPVYSTTLSRLGYTNMLPTIPRSSWCTYFISGIEGCIGIWIPEVNLDSSEEWALFPQRLCIKVGCNW